MDRIVTAFNRYHGWIMAFGVIYAILGGLSVVGSLPNFDIIGIASSIFGYILPAVFVLKFCASARKARLENSPEHIEQACKAQATFILIMGIVSIISLIFMIIAFVIGGAMFGMAGTGI